MALLNFRVDAGDVLGDHLSKASHNATYTSSVIQNQLIDILTKQVRQHIIDKVKVAKWFCIIADEVTDVSEVLLLTGKGFVCRGRSFNDNIVKNPFNECLQSMHPLLS